MKVDVINWNSEKVGQTELNEEVFGATIREDIMHRVVLWQLAKRRSGNHKVKTRGEVSGSTKKIYKQKGTGGARHGSKRAPIFRKGGVVFGPLVRDHGYKLNKKVRALGLMSALSHKLQESSLYIVDHAKFDVSKTKEFLIKTSILNSGKGHYLIIDSKIDQNLSLSIANLHNINVLPVEGLNVYDLLKAGKVIITMDAQKCIEKRLAR